MLRNYFLQEKAILSCFEHLFLKTGLEIPTSFIVFPLSEQYKAAASVLQRVFLFRVLMAKAYYTGLLNHA
jgi:hypothetical protein